MPITIDQHFLTVNDYFFERIGIDFDFRVDDDQDDSKFGFVDVNNQPLTVMDIPVSQAQTRLEDIGAVFPNPSPNPPGPAEIGGSIRFIADNDFDTAPQTSLTFDLRSGIRATPNTAGRVQNQGVATLELNVPLNLTDDLEFEVDASFDADIVEPLEGRYSFGAFVEVTPTKLSELRFSGPSQRFFYDSDSLGPYDNLFSASDFSTDMGVLQFRGDNTVPFMIDPGDIVNGQVFLQVYTDILLENLGSTTALLDATQTASFTLRSLTPGVTFQRSFGVPEPGTLGLVALGLLTRPRRGRVPNKLTPR